uniref:Uncharacterized protein n=1 Tax=Arabidopsis thaliana TaxID=3702 RepID=Q0WKY4_ARATH|nr:hypothetical protein [Arabidopsis thaliana]
MKMDRSWIQNKYPGKRLWNVKGIKMHEDYSKKKKKIGRLGQTQTHRLRTQTQDLKQTWKHFCKKVEVLP